MKTPVLWPMVFHLLALPIAAGAHHERFVVREGTFKSLQRQYTLENVKRIIWEFYSKHDIKSETIYDSNNNQIAKDGIWVDCFKTYCSLTLIRARKEDAGTYLGWIEQSKELETINDNHFKLQFEIEIVIRGPKSETLVVHLGDSVILPCEHNIRNVTRTRWSHISLQGVHTNYLYNMGSKEKLDSNYEALCRSHQLACYLKILRVSEINAGKYICMYGDTLDYEQKYGYHDMTVFVEIDLVVGVLNCNEDMQKDLVLLGENDCYRMERDVLDLKCSFSYIGNININLLDLRWIDSDTFDLFGYIFPISHDYHEQNGLKTISIRSHLTVSSRMENSNFHCILKESNIKPCQLHGFRVQYIRNVTSRSPPMYLDDLHDIECAAIKSNDVKCSYYWVHEIGGAILENPYVILPSEHLNSPGIYTCIAKCNVRDDKECIIKAMEVEVIKNGIFVPTKVLVLVITTCLIIIVIGSARQEPPTHRGHNISTEDVDKINKGAMMNLKDARSLEGLIQSFDSNKHHTFICMDKEPLITAFDRDLNIDYNIECRHILSEICELLLIDGTLYASGRSRKISEKNKNSSESGCFNDNADEVIINIDTESGDKKSVTVLIAPKLENGILTMSRTRCKEILLIMDGGLYKLSRETCRASEIPLSFDILDVLDLGERKYLVSSSQDLCIINENGNILKSYIRSASVFMPRALSVDKNDQIYVSCRASDKVNDYEILVLDRDLKRMKSMKVDKMVHRMRYVEADHTLVVALVYPDEDIPIFSYSKLLTFKL